MQQPDRSWTIVVAIMAVLVFGFVGLAVLGYVALNSLGIEGAGFSEEEFAELEAQYGPAVEEVKRQTEADIQRQREELAAARTAIPDDAPIPRDWDFRECLMAAWLPVEEETLDALSVDFVGWYSDPGSLSEETLSGLEHTLGSGPEAGDLTELEGRFDPSVHSAQAVLDHFREYVLTAPFLDEMEAGIDLDLCRYIRDIGEAEDEAFIGRRYTAARLLACRAIVLQQQGDRQAALKTIERGYRLAEMVIEEPVTSAYSYYFNTEPREAAHSALQYVLSEGPADAAFRERMLACLERQADPDVLATRLRSSVVSAPHEDYSFEGLGERATSFYVYKAFALAEELIALLERPYYEVEGEIGDAANRFTPEFLRELEEEEPDISFKDAVEMLKMSLGVMQGGDGGMMLSLLGTELANMCRCHARDALDGPLVAAAFALAEYKEKDGTYPDTLDALVPAFLPAMPVDPASGEPVTYERFGDGYELTAPCLWKYDEETEVLWQAPK